MSMSVTTVHSSEIRSAPLATHEHNIMYFRNVIVFLVGEGWIYRLLGYDPL